MERMDTTEKYHFELELKDVFRSLASYSTNEEGQRQLRFDPPVYTQRYSTVLSILSHEPWKDEIKKVSTRTDVVALFTRTITNLLYVFSALGRSSNSDVPI